MELPRTSAVHSGIVVEQSQGENRLGRNGHIKFHIRIAGSTLVAQGNTACGSAVDKQNKVL